MTKELEQPLLTSISHQENKSEPLATLSDFHFSSQGLPSRSACLKKYALMALGSLGGLGYWGVTNNYNEKHQFPKFIAISNNIGVAVSVGLFLLQSVDMALKLMDQLSGVVPEELKSILKLASEKYRKSIKRNTWVASIVSGFSFLIIALNDTLPPIAQIDSEVWRKIGIVGWALYFFGDQVWLHLLPFTVLQKPDNGKYRLPLIWAEKLYHCIVGKPDPIDLEIASIIDQLTKSYDEIRAPIADRVADSLEQFISKITSQITWRCRYDLTDVQDFLENKQGLDRLFNLLEQYPPRQPAAVSAYSRPVNLFLRLFGAHIQLGSGFVWWTNVYPALFRVFKQAGLNVGLTYFLSGIFGFLPSYALVVLLAFFGEMQFPRLVNYTINGFKKMLGFPSAPLIPAEAQIKPLLFPLVVAFDGFITWFSSVNAKSLNEELYQDVFSANEMTVLNLYSDVGVRILAFIALLDLYLHYLVETAAVFGEQNSHQQILARLLLIKENLPQDIMRAKPSRLIAELKKLNPEKIERLLGPDKTNEWLTEQEQKINQLKSQLALKKREKIFNESKSTGSIQQQKPAPGLLARGWNYLFSGRNRQDGVGNQSESLAI